MSPNAYMELGAVNRLMGDGRLATGAALRLDAPPTPAFFAAVRAMPQVAGITSRVEMLANFDRMMARDFRITTVLALAAVPLGWLCGWLFAGYLARGFESEQYQVPMVVRSGTYAFATAVVL